MKLDLRGGCLVFPVLSCGCSATTLSDTQFPPPQMALFVAEVTVTWCQVQPRLRSLQVWLERN